ncbi:MAG: mechanosensitive ion channel [Bacteroidales bacterium]|nr:mechanosensitive ion channel [Candidatus Colimorpha pelethequi]
MLIATAQTAEIPVAVPTAEKPIVVQNLPSDSLQTAIKDSLSNINIDQIKGIVTGENTLVTDALKSLIDMAIDFAPKLLVCILILWIGFKLIKILKKTITKLLDKRNVEASLKTFLTSFTDVILKILIVIMAMDVIGIKATSFIAILGAMGLAIGMALQGTLQNFAGGVIILLLKPFKVGDYIECGAYKGYVREMRIFHTLIQPFNGRIIIVPNSELATKSLINHTHEPIIRLDVVASVAYGTDLGKAKEILQSVIDADTRILKEPKAPKIVVTELGNSSVDFTLWMWTKTEDYWGVWENIRENIYNAFNSNGIEIPFPQMDVHVKNN